MREIPGQVDLMDALVDVKREQDYAARQTCPHCEHTYWAAPNHPYWTLARQAEEHVEVEPGICRRMAEIRDELTGYETGKRAPSPEWSKRDLSIHIFVTRDLRDHIWRAYDSRQAAGS